MSWFDSLPAADTTVPCGTGRHTVRWEAGRLTLSAHPDAEAEMVLGALGGDKPGCVTLAETWARHADDLAVLTAGPRCAADRVSVDWADVEELRGQLPAHWTQLLSGTGPGPAATGSATTTARQPRRIHYGSTGQATGGQSPPFAGFASLGMSSGAGMADMVRRQLLQVELLELLALGSEFQFRLAGTVTAAWSGPDRADARARRRPELSGVLTGRFAPAAQDWLGIDPDTVTVTPHEGPGWGTMQVTGTGRGRRLRASLPLRWLADVWACGLAVVDGHLVVAVPEPGHPVAGVLALSVPDAEPVQLVARAATGGASSASAGRGEIVPPGGGSGQVAWTL
jgi:hypothetical protein